MLIPQILDVLKDIVTGHHQVKQGLRATHIAVPLALQDARQLLPSQISKNTLLAEGIATVITTYQVASFSTPPARRMKY